MQSYPIDSPEAAARVLAMALVADGHYSMTELKAVDRLDIPRQLGLTSEDFKTILDRFCLDLLATGDGQWCAGVPAEVRQQLLSEVRAPDLRMQVRRHCEAIMQADGHLAEGETELLDALAGAWQPAEASAS
ncbi:MAG: TerB family tellurite resistance protein [Burkholderiales bacterium]|nr:MAG: TerB family tellurite resistance protein [Burkholderiales bacterium]